MILRAEAEVEGKLMVESDIASELMLPEMEEVLAWNIARLAGLVWPVTSPMDSLLWCPIDGVDVSLVSSSVSPPVRCGLWGVRPVLVCPRFAYTVCSDWLKLVLTTFNKLVQDCWGVLWDFGWKLVSIVLSFSSTSSPSLSSSWSSSESSSSLNFFVANVSNDWLLGGGRGLGLPENMKIITV